MTTLDERFERSSDPRTKFLSSIASFVVSNLSLESDQIKTSTSLKEVLRTREGGVMRVMIRGTVLSVVRMPVQLSTGSTLDWHSVNWGGLVTDDCAGCGAGRRVGTLRPHCASIEEAEPAEFGVNLHALGPS